MLIDEQPAITHSKVMIIDSVVVITGSFNFTSAAKSRNVENLLVLRSVDLATAYTANGRPALPPPLTSFPRTSGHHRRSEGYMEHRHINAACAGFAIGCLSGFLVVVTFPQGSLGAGIELMLINGVVVGVAALVVSLVTARRPPPP